jgi:hypothetical protein
MFFNDEIEKIKNTHNLVNKYINKVYNFKEIWEKKCSKYNVKSQPHVLPAVKRIIVIGDLHGDWDMTIKTLNIAKLIDNNNNWIGNDTVVVQVGDQIDRCRSNGLSCDQKEATNPDEGNDWKILRYFTRLHHQAQKVGGAVYSLLGNHELLNVKGDFRYVSYEGLREFDRFYNQDNKKYYLDGKDVRKWAFQPGNPISEFLACTRQMSLIIGSNLFVHAGILPEIAKKYNVKNMNKLMSLYLFDNLKDSKNYFDIFDSSDYSPLWNRVIGNMGLDKYNNKTYNKKNCDNILIPLKNIYNVDKIFVGHTPLLNSGMGNICNKKIWLTDYGSSKAFDKFDNNSRNDFRKAQVLEILNDGETINILQ